MRKKLISWLLILATGIIGLSLNVHAIKYGDEYENKPTKAYSQVFLDVPKSHWAFSYIGEMAERGVIDGYMDGCYYPEKNVSRAEFAKIMTVTAGVELTITDARYFADTPVNAWYTPYVNAAKSYLSGYITPNGSYYYPDSPALREDIAVALVKLKGYDTFGADESILETMFDDTESISNDARKYVATAIERGLVSGYDDRTFRGQDSITRAEAAAMLWRAYQYGNDNKQFGDGYENDYKEDDWNSTVESTYIPTPTPTQKPTQTPTPTPKPTPTPTPKLTPTPEPERPYEMDTIVKADVKSMTYDNDNDIIYYYDESDNIVYILNADSERVRGFMDVGELIMREDGKFNYEIDGNNESELVNESSEDIEADSADDSELNEPVLEYYKNFEVRQLYYDNINKKLLLTGYFMNKTDWQDYKDHSSREWAILDITDEDKPMLYSKLSRDGKIETVLNNGCILNSRGEIYDLENQEELNGISLNGAGKYIIQNNNTLYSIILGTAGGGASSLKKFDFMSINWTDARDDNFYTDVVGVKNGEYYLWRMHNKILKLDTNGVLYDMGIDTSEDIEIIDMMSYPESPHTAFDYTTYYVNDFYISDNGNYIFYDIKNKAIRIIRKR